MAKWFKLLSIIIKSVSELDPIILLSYSIWDLRLNRSIYPWKFCHRISEDPKSSQIYIFSGVVVGKTDISKHIALERLAHTCWEVIPFRTSFKSYLAYGISWLRHTHVVIWHQFHVWRHWSILRGLRSSWLWSKQVKNVARLICRHCWIVSHVDEVNRLLSSWGRWRFTCNIEKIDLLLWFFFNFGLNWWTWLLVKGTEVILLFNCWLDLSFNFSLLCHVNLLGKITGQFCQHKRLRFSVFLKIFVSPISLNNLIIYNINVVIGS